MRFTLGLITGTALTLVTRAYAPAVLWWIFTTDTRNARSR